MALGAELEAAISRAKLQQFQDAAAITVDEVGSRRDVRLTVGIATHDDFDGAFFTVSSLLIHHREALQDAEILILDNHPQGQEAESLAKLAAAPPPTTNIRYIPYSYVQSTAVRDAIFRFAGGEVVVILDSHVLLEPGALSSVLRYFESPDRLADMVQGPLLSQSGHTIAATHMDPVFSKGMYGTWGSDPRGEDLAGEAFDIELHGLAAFAMKRTSWPGLNSRFQGFGGEEGYIHEKVRQAGGRTVCLPAFRWHHRFLRPRGITYPNRWEDRLNNYLTGWSEIGYSLNPVTDHFAELLGEAFPRIYQQAMHRLQHPARSVDGIAVLSDDSRVAPWNRAMEHLQRAAIEAARIPLPPQSAATAPESTHTHQWTATLADIHTSLHARGWDSAIILDENWAADIALISTLARDLKEAANPITLYQPAIDDGALIDGTYLPGPVVVKDLSALTTLTGSDQVSVRPLDRAVLILTSSPRPQLATSITSAYVTAYPCEDSEWLSTYQRFAQWGLGTVTHQLPMAELLEQARDTAHLQAITRKLSQVSKEGTDSCSTLFAQPGVRLLDGGDVITAKALDSLHSSQWDVLVLSASAHQPEPDDSAADQPVSLVRSHPFSGSAAALLVSSRGRQRWLEAHERHADARSLNDFLLSSLSTGGLLVRQLAQPVIATNPDLGGLPALTASRYRFH